MLPHGSSDQDSWGLTSRVRLILETIEAKWQRQHKGDVLGEQIRDIPVRVATTVVEFLNKAGENGVFAEGWATSLTGTIIPDI